MGIRSQRQGRAALDGVSSQNRAERRKAESMARRKQGWVDDVEGFAGACQGGFLENYIIPVDNVPDVVMAAIEGHPVASTLAEPITRWAHEAAAPDAAFLCLNCDQKFGPDIATPVVLMIAVPFIGREHAIVSGVCRSCVDSGEDLQQMSLRRMKSIWPNVYIADGGHA
jgi:hypothetical protein